MKTAVKKWALLVAKVGLSAALLAFILSRLELRSAIEQIQGLALRVISLVLALLAAQMLLSALRFSWVGRLLGAVLPLEASLRLTAIGAFFSQTFVSFLGGDGMRVWQLARWQVPTGLAARAVFVDRAIGFVILFFLVSASLPVVLPLAPSGLARDTLAILALGGVLGFIAFAVLPWLPGSLQAFRIIDLFVKLSVAMRVVLIDRRHGVLALFASLGIHLINILIIYTLAVGFGAPISLRDVALLAPAILLLSMLPISYAGWGLREGAMVLGFGLVGVPHNQSLAVSIMFGLSSLVIALPGGLVWALSRRRPIIVATAATAASRAAISNGAVAGGSSRGFTFTSDRSSR